MNKKLLANVWEQVRFFAVAIIIAVGLRSCLYEPFRIPSGSMLPTLLVGDYVFVSKFSYGYSRYSFPFGIVPLNGRVLRSQPQRGDVAVFRNPVQPDIIYIKRIVGLPNDKIQVINGRLHINGNKILRERSKDFEGIVQYHEYFETKSFETKSHMILEEEGDTGAADNTRIYYVPEGHYFAMGDNRDNSQDSRYLSAVGFIPEENLVGRAVVTWLSLGNDFWPFSIRLNRFLKKIQ